MKGVHLEFGVTSQVGPVLLRHEGKIPAGVGMDEGIPVVLLDLHPEQMIPAMLEEDRNGISKGPVIIGPELLVHPDTVLPATGKERRLPVFVQDPGCNIYPVHPVMAVLFENSRGEVLHQLI